MKREILQYEYTCDKCGAVERVERIGIIGESLPEGWKREAVTDCGMTGYTRLSDVCGKCGQVERTR